MWFVCLIPFACGISESPTCRSLIDLAEVCPVILLVLYFWRLFLAGLYVFYMPDQLWFRIGLMNLNKIPLLLFNCLVCGLKNGSINTTNVLADRIWSEVPTECKIHYKYDNWSNKKIKGNIMSNSCKNFVLFFPFYGIQSALGILSVIGHAFRTCVYAIRRM